MSSGKRLGRRHDRHADLDGKIARRHLVAKPAHGVGLGPMKMMPFSAQASANSGLSDRRP
jgi:hypothetical protein